MKLISSLLLTLLFASFTFSQETNYKEIDSLLVLLNTKQVDTVRANTYSEICNIYSRIDLDKADEYCEKLLKFSKNINYLKGIGCYYKHKSKILSSRGKSYEAIVFAEKAAIIFIKINDKRDYILALDLKAIAFITLEKKEEAEKLLLFSLYESNKINFTKENGTTHFLLGYIYANETKLLKAILNYKKAIYFFRKAKVSESLISCYRDISNIYLITNQESKALEYVDSALAIMSELNIDRPTLKADLFRLKGQILTNMKIFSGALLCLNKSLLNNYKSGNKRQVANDLFYLSRAYYGLKSYNKVIYVCTEGLKSNDDTMSLNLYYMLGETYYILGDYKKSQFNQIKSLSIINTKKFFFNGISKEALYKSISKTEFALGNFKQAYLYQEKYSSLEKQSLLDEKKDRINELQTRFDVNEKEIALKNLTISKQKKDIEFQKEKNKLMTSSIVLGSTIILLGFISFGYKKNIKKNKVLKEQNQIITTKNIEIETTQRLLVKSLKEKEILLKEIHHRVKNNLQLVMSLLNIQARQGDYFDINDFLEKGQSRIASMALIHQNIYQTENLDRVDFQEYLVNLVENLKNSFSGKQGNIAFSINAKDIYFDIETSIPLGLVINELVCNALKHAFPDDMDGKISIELNQKENNNFELTIRDNGIGIEKTVKSKKSLGLELVNLLVAQLKGKINIESVFGTNYKINFQEIRET